MSENVLVVETRTEFGKGAARRARRAGFVPGVLYGAGEETLHLDVPGHDLFLIARSTKGAKVELQLDGKKVAAFIKSVQVHPVSRALLHVDFQLDK